MSRGGSRYHPPTMESLSQVDDYMVKTALRVLFGERVNVDRLTLVMIGVPQHHVNELTDRQVRRYDLRPFAFRVLHQSISALVSEHKPKPNPSE